MEEKIYNNLFRVEHDTFSLSKHNNWHFINNECIYTAVASQ